MMEMLIYLKKIVLNFFDIDWLILKCDIVNKKVFEILLNK